MVFVAAVQAPVFVLMDDPSPVAQFDVCLEKVRQCRQRDPVGFHLFQRFDKLLAYLSVIELVHAEDDASFAGKRCRNLFAVYQPKGTRNAFLNEKGGFAIGICFIN